MLRNVLNCLQFTQWRHICNMAQVDPALLVRQTSRKQDGLPDKIKHRSGATAVGIMAIVIEDCEIVTPGYLSNGSESYGVRRITGLPLRHNWEFDLNCWGSVLGFTGTIVGPVSAAGISFATQGEGKGIESIHSPA
jgi:hypothetical protein